MQQIKFYRVTSLPTAESKQPCEEGSLYFVHDDVNNFNDLYVCTGKYQFESYSGHLYWSDGGSGGGDSWVDGDTGEPIDPSLYLPLTGGTMSGDITMSGENKLIFGDIPVYNNGSLFIDGTLQVENQVSANGFTHAINNSNDYVLLAGGGAKPLAEINKPSTHGGYIYVELFSKTDFYEALSGALNSLSEGESAIIDCTYFNGTHTISQGFTISNPVTLIFGPIHIKYDNLLGTNLFTLESNNITIKGNNRNTDKNNIDLGSTVFEMLNADTTLNGYHIKSRGNKNLEFANITFKGLRTTMGRQYNNISYPLNGVGGIYIEKGNPGGTIAGNTCNNIRIDNILIAGSKAHGIYIDTPILTTITNVRLSDCGGHSIFISGGTSILLENVYSSSANMAGFCVSGASYVSFNNCVSENSGIGFWIRSSFNVSLFSPGVEETKTYGSLPWKLSYPISGKYGLGLVTTNLDGTEVDISDVNSDYASSFIGYGILISGGKAINVFTPYVKSIANTLVTEAYTGGTSVSNKVKYIYITGDNRSSYILNPSFKETNANVSSSINHEIGIDSTVTKLELVYDVSLQTIIGTVPGLYIVNSSNEKASIYNASVDSAIRSGTSLLTPYTVQNPLYDLDIANKLYVDTKLDISGGTITGDTKFNGASIYFDEDCAALKINDAGALEIYSEDGIALSGYVDCDGSITCASEINAQAFYETSDARKKDIKSDISLDKCYDLIDKCQTVIYSLKDQTKEQVGMIAQEIEEFFPEVVATDEEGFKSLAYDRLVVICFKVLKDVIKRLEKLEQ